MSIGRAIRFGLVAGVVLTIFVHAATAETVSMRYDGTGAGSQVKITSALFNGNAFAGQIHQTISGGSSIDGSWITFCTDLSQHVSGSFNPFEIVTVDFLPSGSPMGAAKANAIRDLYAYAGGSQLLDSTANALAAAFQLALWEVLVDFDDSADGHALDITAGGFSATKTNGDAFSATLMSHLSSLFGAIGTVDSSGVQLVGLSSGQHQDQIIVIPAPAALALVGAAAITRRRRR
ncbi:MAG: hypothetical protein FJ253_05000 [Phycisphaerae bacterium]|nr:hypothetical protein [Phycisphaerae bacterium]